MRTGERAHPSAPLGAMPHLSDEIPLGGPDRIAGGICVCITGCVRRCPVGPARCSDHHDDHRCTAHHCHSHDHN